MRPRFTIAAAVVAIAGSLPASLAWAPPQYDGFRLVWGSPFEGPSGASPNLDNWDVLDGDLGVNNELQVYSPASRNVQLSGGDTLQLVPWRDGGKTRGWSSGRLESKYTFVPEDGKTTRAESLLRFGIGGRRQGLWPAFWLLGDGIRRGTPWPACGEIDVMEVVNGDSVGHGTVHCDVFPGGACNEGGGISSQTSMGNGDWHVWRVEWDRRPGGWQDETITWFLDGNQFHQVSGGRLNNEGAWAALAHNPLFFILNLAVGGNWPGQPAGDTLDGWDAMLEVAYVAHYVQS